MDEPLQDDIKDSYLPKQASDTTSCVMSQSSSDHDAEREEGRCSKTTANETVLVDVVSTHQSGSLQTHTGFLSEECLSVLVEGINCSDNHEQPVPDIYFIIPQSSSSKNIQQEIQTSVDVSPSEGIVISQNLDCETASNISNDSGLSNGSVRCYDYVPDNVEINGCEDVPPEQDSDELDKVLCATLENNLNDVGQLQEFCPLTDAVELSIFADGREKFSEKPDQEKESHVKSTQLVCDRGDQNCTSFIPNELTDLDTNVLVERCKNIDKTDPSNDFCILAEGTVCNATNKPCKHFLIKTVAASVVDEILELATKHLLGPKPVQSDVDGIKSNVDSENIADQINMQAASGKTVDTSESFIKFSDGVSNSDQPLDLNSSFANAADKIASKEFDVVVPSLLVTDHSHSYLENNSASLMSIMCNGSIVSSSHSNFDDGVSKSTPCDSEFLVKEDGLNSMAKVDSLNDSSEISEDLDKCLEAHSSQKNKTSTLGFNSNQNLNLEAKVESSKNVNVGGEGKSSIVLNLEKCEEEIASSSLTPVFHATKLDEDDLQLNSEETNFKVEKTLSDPIPPLSHNVDCAIVLKCAGSELNSKKTASDCEINCISVNNCNTEFIVAKVEDTTEEKAANDITLSSAVHEDAEGKAEIICSKEELALEDENAFSNEKTSVVLHEPSGKVTGNCGDTPEEEISSASNSPDDKVDNEKKVEEVRLRDDISASIPLLEKDTEDFADEDQNSTVMPSEVTAVSLANEELMGLKTSNNSVESGQVSLSTVTCQFIVPAVNVYPPIMEETYDGITDDESDISHATSDSENDSSMKNVKPVCDGMNTINYRPLLEDDSNDRSTLSLISEMDEASVKEDTLDNEQWEEESTSLIMDDGVDRVDKMEKDNLRANSELVQRVKGQRIRHDKIKDVEDISYRKGEISEEVSLNAKYAEKMEDIRDALKSTDSLARLQELARSEGGLVNDELRKQVWPRLLNIDSSSASNPLPPIKVEDLRAHHEYNQVVLDVNRSLRRFPSKISPQERVDLQNQLTEIILRVLMKRKNLSYYQGYHDVAVTTLLVAGKEAAFHILERISTAHLSDCMLPTMERTMFLLNYIYPLLQRINPNLAERMDRLEIGTIFCLPWLLTWYGYSLNRYEDIVRVFDYFLASPPLAPLYLAAVVVGRRSAEVLAADPDHATVHSLLSRIPECMPLEDLLREATDLYRNYPPDDIEKEVHERCEMLRKAQEEEEEQRKRRRQRRMVQRRHSMPTIAARQMPGWFFIDRFLALPMIQGRRFIQVSATVMFGMIAWHLRSEVYRYF